MHKTYTLFLRIHLHTIAFCILTPKQFRKIHRKPSVPEPRFYQSYMKERLRHSCFSVKLRNFSEHYFIEHVRVIVYVGHGVRF